MKQIYNNYTEEDHEVWGILFNKQIENLQDKACEEYLSCLNHINHVLNGNYIPDYDHLNRELLKETGWSIEVVEGLIPVADFYSLLAEKKFCAPAWIRKKSQIDYLEEPDMFHDITGHIPLFLYQQYADFVQKIGEIGVKYAGNKQIEKELERIYWFTSEFGAIMQNGKLKAYGAGIISSYNEAHNLYKVEIEPIDFETVINKIFRTDVMQTSYYIINNYDELHQLLKDFEKRCEKFIDCELVFR